MTARPRGAAAAAALLLCLLPADAAPQVRASELGTVKQVIDGTTLTIEYSRPVARGRTGLFGEVVHWGEVWTPGANWATTLEIDKPIHVNGQALDAGKYSIWMVLREAAPWTVLFHPEHRRFHTQRPDTTGAALRLAVSPETAPHLETLTWSFPVVGASGATLAMQWGTTMVPLRVLVEPSVKAATVAADQRARYIGSYALSWTPPPAHGGEPPEHAEEAADTAEPSRHGGHAAAPDSAAPGHATAQPQRAAADDGGHRPPAGAGERQAPPQTLVVYEEGDRLYGRMEPPFPGEFDPYVALFPTGQHRFMPGFLMQGELVEADPEMAVVFIVEDGRAVGLEFQGLEARVMARGERKEP